MDLSKLAADAARMLRALTWTAVLASAACGGTSSGSSNGQINDGTMTFKDASLGDVAPDSSNDAGATDAATVEDMLMDALEVGGSDAQSSADAEVADGTDSNCEFASSPKPGEPGAGCKANGDCKSDLCVEGPQGKICTVACTSCCPTGFNCAAYGIGSGDQTFVCLPKVNALCQPCNADAECSKTSPGALCILYGEAGSFCGASCDSGADCPNGYACQEQSKSAKQCVKLDKTCTCSPAAISAGANTSCSISNAIGVCTGARKCLSDGLSACSASTPATETCGNSTDDNCDGATDEDGALGCTTYFADYDGDGTGAIGSVGKCLCIGTSLYSAVTATDCDDSNKGINTGAKELCNDVDDDCDGGIDNGCDDDGDGWCDANMIVVGAPAVCVKGKKDCNDAQVAVHPGQVEICGNGLDDDCDGLTDAGANATACVPFFQDDDGDGYGTGESVCQCAATGLYSAATPGDCDDANPKVHPNAPEVCNNGKDDNCNGVQNEQDAQGCNEFYVDLDVDGYGTATPTCLCAAVGNQTALTAGDCDDAAAAIHPNAVEICDGLDNNCVDGTDEEGALGCSTLFADLDGDSYGDPMKKGCVCAVSLAYAVTDASDCNDAQATAHPGAEETCDGIDNDCDGLTDEAGAGGCALYFADSDGDGYGETATFACLCGPSASYKVTKLGDCADDNAAINPGATEICDGIDNNCTGTIDENGAKGCTAFFYDGDTDGYGLDTAEECLCASAGLYTATVGGDCNDADSAIHPKTTDICDGLDNDCDGATDPVNAPGCVPWYADKDGDGYGTMLLASKCLCGSLDGYAKAAGDCNDGDSAVNPGAVEICNGKDDNCDGIKDPKGTQDCTNYYADGDNDGYGVTSLSQCACTADNLFKATLSGDCNDGNFGIHPGAPELCDQVDNNCNGQVDEGLMALFYQDADGDGWGGNVSHSQCAADALYASSTSGDCDDTKFAIHPGATEVCNYVDDNCDGQIDEGTSLATYYADKDGDTFGGGAGKALCGPTGLFTVQDGSDCDDTKFGIHPGATEICDGLDNNCNNQVDEGMATATWFTDGDKDGYGTGGGATLCGPLGTTTAAVSGDCNDGNPQVYPGATELCDGVDNNCDTQVDEGFTFSTYYVDADSDTYGTGTGLSQCGPRNGFTVTTAGDCNDTKAAIHPNATEVCGNGVDDNCNSQIDEGCVVCTAALINGLNSASGVTLGPDEWWIDNWLKTEGSKALNWEYGLNVDKSFDSFYCGYVPVPNDTASLSITIPTGALFVTADVVIQNIRNSGVDNTAVLTLSLNGSVLTFGPYATDQTGLLKVAKWPVPQSLWGTSVTFSATMNTSLDSANCAGGVAVDNIRAACN